MIMMMIVVQIIPTVSFDLKEIPFGCHDLPLDSNGSKKVREVPSTREEALSKPEVVQVVKQGCSLDKTPCLSARGYTLGTAKSPIKRYPGVITHRRRE